MHCSATSKPKVELVDMEESDPRLVVDLYPVLHELRFKLTEEQLQSGVEGMGASACNMYFTRPSHSCMDIIYHICMHFV